MEWEKRPQADGLVAAYGRWRFCWQGTCGVFARCVLVGAFVALSCARAEAAVVHAYLPEVSTAISEAADSCGSVTGPLGAVNASVVDQGDLWLAERRDNAGADEERVDELDAATGACVSQLGPAPSLERLFQGVAVGHRTGEREVYVGAAEKLGGETGARVAVFGPTGALQAVWTGRDTPNGSAEHPDGFAESGGTDKANVTDVAVDESESLDDWAIGDVFVSTASKETGVVDVFEPEAGGAEPPKVVKQLIGTCSLETVCTVTEEEEHRFSGPHSVAVDPGNGDLLVADGHVVDVFEPVPMSAFHEYKFLRQITETSEGRPVERPIKTLASGGGEGNGDVYVVEEGGAVAYQLSVEGAFLGSLTATPAGPFANVESVAVDPSSHDVFIGDNRTEEGEAGVVDVFGPDLVVPDASTEPATEETATTAVLNGTVNPLSAETHEGATCEFEYGTSASYGLRVPCGNGVPGPGAEKVSSATVEGLTSGTTYHYRLVAKNRNGSNAGADETFTTKGPEIVEESASKVASTSATLNATINPGGAETSYFFEYSTSSTERARHRRRVRRFPASRACRSARAAKKWSSRPSTSRALWPTRNTTTAS